MVDKNFVRKLALERCRVHISHLCALTHLSGELDGGGEHVRDSLSGLFENLNRDLSLIEGINIE